MADNDLADLNSRLATAIRDASHATWATGEKDEIIKQAVRQLWPRYSRPMDPQSTVALVEGTVYYNLPTGMRAVSRLELIDPAGEDMGSIPDRSWEVVGDTAKGTGKIRISPVFARGDYTLYVLGYGVYDTSTNLIPDELAPLVLARARAEAYRRLAADRERFKNWLVRNQVQNVSVNELLQFINEADAEANRLVAATGRTWQRPVPGYVG